MDRGRFVVATESVHGGRLVGTHAFFGYTPDEAEARRRAYEARKYSQATRLGQPPATSLVWQSIAPSNGSYSVAQGARYAGLASVSKNYSLADVQNYLNGHGWAVTYAWEQGQASRAEYAIDDWLASLAPDTTDNHRWLYVEGNRTGSDATLGASAPWPFTFYAIANVFQAVPAPPSAPAPAPTLPATVTPAAPSTSSPATYVVGGIAAGALLTGALFALKRFVF